MDLRGSISLSHMRLRDYDSQWMKLVGIGSWERAVATIFEREHDGSFSIVVSRKNNCERT